MPLQPLTRLVADATELETRPKKKEKRRRRIPRFVTRSITGRETVTDGRCPKRSETTVRVDHLRGGHEDREGSSLERR
jgi:hypothetical protein